MLADCFAPVCTLVGKTWTLHLEKVVKVDRDENLRMIAESVAFLVAQGKRVIYDAEHFFDGFFDDGDYALRCLRTAGEATLTVGRNRERVIARELSLEERAEFFRNVIGPYVRRLRIGGLLLSVLGAKEILDDPAHAAEHRPVFELRAV